MTHILICRERSDSGGIWRRSEHNGAGWSTATGITTDFFGLLDAVIGGLLENIDLTISTRGLDDLISRSPDQLGIPPHLACTLFMPSGRTPTDPIWTTLISVPPEGQIHAMRGGDFVSSTLGSRLVSIFGDVHGPRDGARAAWCAPYARRELWVRRGMRAATICPDAFPAPKPVAPQQLGPDGVPKSVDRRSPIQIEAEKTKRALMTPLQLERDMAKDARRMLPEDAAPPLERDPVSARLAEKRKAAHRNERMRKSAEARKFNAAAAKEHADKIKASLDAADAAPKRKR